MCKTSIVILSYNRLELLKENLLRIRALASPPDEVIVVDNASSDGSADMVRSEFPKVKVIANESNLGVAKGRNRGFRASQGEIVIYLDDDSLPPDDICEKTVAAFGRYPGAGCIAYQIREGDHQWYACPDGTKVGNYYGGGHAFRRVALEAIDYLDESMWFGGEEIDSSLRLYRAGYDVVAVPSIVITHRSQPVNPETANRRSADSFANSFTFYASFFPISQASLFIGRMMASYVGLCVRRRSTEPLTMGIRRSMSRLPQILNRRDVVPVDLAKFYADPTLVPVHYNRSLLSKAIKKFFS